MKKTIVTACAILLGSIGTMTAQVKLQANNVDEVLKAMTLEEKAMLVVGGNRQIASTDNNGMIGGHAQRVPGAAGTTQAIPRLGIPSTVLTDGPAGVRINPHATTTRTPTSVRASLWARRWPAHGTPNLLRK